MVQPLSFTKAVLLFSAGFIAGGMNAIAGGGTILTFPALIFAGLHPVIANATSTIALLPASLSGFIGYRRHLHVALRWIRLFGAVSLVGGLAGGILLTKTPPGLFEWLVPFLILFATVLFSAHSLFARLFRTGVEHQQGGPSASWMVGAVFFQLAVAVYGGYFGAGIGILMLASLGMLGIGDVHEMNAVKNALAFLINLVAAIYFVVAGLIDWPAAACMAGGAIIGGYASAHFAQRVPKSAVRYAITGIGYLLAIVMFVKQMSR